MNQRSTAKMRFERAQVGADEFLDVGYCTLTATGLARREPRAVARGPIDRPDDHRSARLAKTSEGARPPNSSRRRASMSLYGRGAPGPAVLQLLAKSVGKEVRHDADELADLDEEAAQPEDWRPRCGGRVALVLLAREALRRGRRGESRRDAARADRRDIAAPGRARSRQ